MVTRTLRQRMHNRYKAMSAMSRASLVVYIGLTGAVAGLVAWVVVLVGHMLFEISKPSGLSLLLAIPRGVLFGIILALILHDYWKKHPSKSEPKDK